MSVKAMSRVWDRSKAKGSELLVLLAIADYAEDDGRNAWPTMKVLAEKSRMSERGLRYVLDRLVEAGELEVEANDGRRRVTNGVVPRQFFHVCCCLRKAPANFAGEPEKIADEEPAKIADQPAKFAGAPTGKLRQPNRQTAADQPANGDTHIERSVTDPSQDPSRTARARDGRRPHPLDEVPQQTPELLALFDELWRVYPNPGRRMAAERVWIALGLSELLARFVVAHVRMRVQAGWVAEVGGARYIPHLWRFLEERRWTEQQLQPAMVSASAAREGMLVTRSCPRGCGGVQEGRIRHGEPVYDDCPRCAPAGGDGLQARGGLPS